MKCFYREKKYICGDYMDVQIYPVYRKAGARRKRAKPTSETQTALNLENSRRALVRLLHTNFTKKDFTLLLTYDDALHPGDEDAAKGHIRKFLRKLRVLYKKSGIVLKYVCIPELGVRSGRLHYHLVIPGGVDRSEIESLWEYGWANTEQLRFEASGIKGLGMYLHKDKLFFKSWTCSRNLERPTVVENDYKFNAKKVKELMRSADSFSMWAKEYPGYVMYDKCVKGVDCADSALGARYAGNYIFLNLAKTIRNAELKGAFYED